MKTLNDRSSTDSWVMPIALISVLLGFMFYLAWVDDKGAPSRSSYLESDQAARVTPPTGADAEALRALQLEVKKLRAEKTTLEKTLGDRGNESKVLNTSLQEAKTFAGLTEVVGPGVRIVLQDSKKTSELGGDLEQGIVHDLDVLRVVNELYATGAEAISVNDIRDSVGSTYRCVGPTILVTDQKIATPIVIRAIGDAKTIMGGMMMPGGIVAGFREYDPAMVQIEAMKEMRLPAYAGSTAKRLAKVPDEKKSPGKSEP